MNLIDVNNIDCTKLPKKFYPYMKDILDFFDAQPTIEAIPKDDYEARLRADMVAMLEEIDLEMSEQSFGVQVESWEVVERLRKKVIQEKINALRGEQNEHS